MKRYTKKTAALEAALIAAAIIFLIPLFVLVSVALRDPAGSPGFLGFTWPLKFGNLATAWKQSQMGPSMLNSIMITGISVLLVIGIASTAGYVIARRTERWSRGMFYLFLTGFLFPGQLALVPLYVAFTKAGLVGNPFSVILISTAGNLPFGIFLYTAFLRDLAPDYEEAATLDGATPFRMFRSIVFPLMRPVTGTVGILSSLAIWNDFMHPLLYLTGGSTRTAPLSVYTFVGEYSANWPLVFSALITSVIPILVAYFLMQRFIMRGFATGLKG
ncbi:carbohydrate ABC transporter permease [Kineosporia mesophila]|uniref:Carbohydrate ABC transporter permease n=1 Tax=Kineosporia mesophila TaxID=566012 RepID=A0ABP6ZMI0_9ACTN|nr:carbohydrate ABC transporter permease [Kineosporia mesophila]MCD5353685.1 carbohydrate ABC transporter permease [Kineosporia mesophila]